MSAKYSLIVLDSWKKRKTSRYEISNESKFQTVNNTASRYSHGTGNKYEHGEVIFEKRKQYNPHSGIIPMTYELQSINLLSQS